MKKLWENDTIKFGIILAILWVAWFSSSKIFNKENNPSYENHGIEQKDNFDKSDYDKNGNYKPVEEMNQQEIEEELTDIVQDHFEGGK